MKLVRRNKQADVRFCDGCGSVCDEACRARTQLDQVKLWALTRGAGRIGL